MTCYNMQCDKKDICDEYRSAACLKRITLEQHDLLKKIGSRCERCGSRTVIGELSRSRKKIKICTSCMKTKEIKELILEEYNEENKDKVFQ